MAYAFDKINAALTGEENNIFSPPTSPGLSSSTGGDFNLAPSGGGDAPATPNQPQTSAAKKNVFRANAGKVRSPVDVGGMKSQINDMGTKIQAEADTYVKNATSPYVTEIPAAPGSTTPGYTTNNMPSTEELSNWAKTGSVGLGKEPYPGDPAAYNYDNYSKTPYQAPPDWYTLATTNPVDPGALTFQTNTDIKDIGLLGNDQGVKELFRRQGGEDYTPGMGAFDASLLRGSGQFAADASDVLTSYAGLQKKKGDIAENAPGAAMRAAESAKSTWMDDLNTQARGVLTDMENVQKKEAGAGGSFTDFTQQGDEIKERLIKENPELGPFLNSLDPAALSKMIQDATEPGEAGSTNWKDYIDEGEANAFNRIYGLLKTGDIAVKGNKGGKDASLNWDKLKQSASKGKGQVIVDNLPAPKLPWDGGGQGGPRDPADDEYVPVEGEGEGTSPVLDKKTGKALDDFLKFNPYAPHVLQPQIDAGKDFLNETMPFSPKNIERTNELASGVVDAYTNPAAISPSSLSSFPNILNSLNGGGRSSTYEGKIDPSMIAGSVNLPTLEPVNYQSSTPITPLPSFQGLAGGDVTPDKPKLSAADAEKTKQKLKKAVKNFW